MDDDEVDLVMQGADSPVAAAVAASPDVPRPKSPDYSRLYKWCRTDQSIMRSERVEGGDPVPQTHLSMCGTTKAFHVEDEMLSMFYFKAAKYWQDATFLSENADKDGTHIAFFDLDILLAHGSQWSSEKSSLVAGFLMKQLARVVDDVDLLYCFVTDTEPEAKPSDDELDKVKVGIHVYFPHLYVDVPTHLKLRSLLLVACVEAHRERIGLPADYIPPLEREEYDEDAVAGEEAVGELLANPWGDVLDKAVCKVPKLRMLCSDKAVDCRHSADEKKQLKCGQKRHRVNVGRRYRVVDVLEYKDGEPTRNEEQLALYAAATGPEADPSDKDAVIKLTKTRHDLLMLLSLRKTSPLSAFTFANAEQLAERAAEIDADGNENDGGGRSGKHEMNITQEQVDIVANLMLMLGFVKDLDDVRKVTASGGSTNARYPAQYKAALASKWCFNRGCDHSSNQIYVVVRKGVSLEAFCGNTSDRQSDQGVCCKDFKEPYFLYNPALSQVLFGQVVVPSEFPEGQLSNNELRDPLMAFCLEAIERIQDGRSRQKRMRLA